LSRDDVARLARSVRRELRYHLSLHDLDEDRINPLAVLDEAIASVMPRLQEAQSPRGLEVVLVQEAMAAVTRRIAQLLEKLGREEISTDDPVPSMDKKDRLDGASESYLTSLIDEDLRFEDLLPAPGEAPDTVAETLELEDRIDEVLGTFPLVARNCFLLSTLENLSHEQVAQALNINEEAVRNHIGEAREALRKGLDSELSPSWRKILAG
jgi:RNA polymerase sigma factor (sigma-70 family)